MKTDPKTLGVRGFLTSDRPVPAGVCREVAKGDRDGSSSILSTVTLHLLHHLSCFNLGGLGWCNYGLWFKVLITQLFKPRG